MIGINTDAFRRNFLRILVASVILIGFFYVLIPFWIGILLGGILAMASSSFLCYFIKKGWNRKASLVLFVLFFSL